MRTFCEMCKIRLKALIKGLMNQYCYLILVICFLVTGCQSDIDRLTSLSMEVGCLKGSINTLKQHNLWNEQNFNDIKTYCSIHNKLND